MTAASIAALQLLALPPLRGPPELAPPPCFCCCCCSEKLPWWFKALAISTGRPLLLLSLRERPAGPARALAAFQTRTHCSRALEVVSRAELLA